MDFMVHQRETVTHRVQVPCPLYSQKDENSAIFLTLICLPDHFFCLGISELETLSYFFFKMQCEVKINILILVQRSLLAEVMCQGHEVAWRLHRSRSLPDW